MLPHSRCCRIRDVSAELAMSPALRWSRNVSGCLPTSRYLRRNLIAAMSLRRSVSRFALASHVSLVPL